MTEKGLEFNSVNYIKTPLSASELRDLFQRAGLKPEEAIRTKEPAYKELVLGKNLNSDQLIEIIAAHPELLQRPIVVKEGRAVLAKPVENLEKLGIK